MSLRFKTCPVLAALLGLSLLLGSPHAARAVAFTPALHVAGSVSFDTGFARADGDVTQSGSFSKVAGGVAAASTFSGTAVGAGDGNPLAGTLTDLGDGFGASADVLVAYADPASESGAGFDALLDLSNTSATDSLGVTLKVDFRNAVNASGTNAYANSSFTVSDVTDPQNWQELFFTDLRSDTVFGNFPTETEFGGPLSESGLAFLHLVVAPGATTHLKGSWTLKSGVFVDGGQAETGAFGFLSIDKVENQNQPPAPVPEPGSVVLLGSGLLALAGARRRPGRG